MYTNAYQRSWYKALAFFAWFTIVAGEILTVINYMAPKTATPEPTLFQLHPHASGFLLRFIDEYSYFTNWSVVAVALVFTKLAYSKKAISQSMKIFMPTSLLMIIITGILFNLLIAPKYPPHGLYVYTSACQHIITPIFALVVWLFVGPHVMTFKRIHQYFLIPIVYVLFITLRGSINHLYPYGFLDAAKYGYADFYKTALEILVFGSVILAILIPIDRRLGSRRL